MSVVLRFLNVLLPVVYLATTGLYYWSFATDSRAARRWGRGALIATILIHVATTALQMAVLDRLPLESPPEFFSMMALSLCLLYLVIETRVDIRQTGLLIVGLAFLLQFFASAFATPGEAPQPSLLGDPGFALHVLLAVIAYTAMSLSFLYALLYLMQSRQLRRRNFGLLYRRMPPLDVLERMSVGAAKLAVPLLFASLAIGHLWMYALRDRVAPEVAATLSPWDPKVIASWIVFIVYAVGLVGHQFLGWRGRRMSILAIVAYVGVLGAMGAIHHFFHSFHHFSLRELLR